MTDGAPPAEWVAGCLAAQDGLLAALRGLDDAAARRPSLLPGWSVGHVLTHIARNADSVVWRLEGAAAGEVRDQYPGGLEQRKAEIEAGVGRPAGVLMADVSRTSAAVAEVMAGCPWRPGHVLSRMSRGVVETSRRTRSSSRWREVVVHHGDLGLGPVALPSALVDAWLPRELARLAERTDPARLLSWVIGRGDPPALQPW